MGYVVINQIMTQITCLSHERKVQSSMRVCGKRTSSRLGGQGRLLQRGDAELGWEGRKE